MPAGLDDYRNKANRTPAIPLRSLSTTAPFEADPERGILADKQENELPPGTCTPQRYRIIMSIILFLLFAGLISGLVAMGKMINAHGS
jgi:hypothetical protein